MTFFKYHFLIKISQSIFFSDEESSSQAPGVYGVRAQMFDKVEIQKKKIISNHVTMCRPALHLPRPLLSAAVMSVAPEEVLILEEKTQVASITSFPLLHNPPEVARPAAR